ncbi:MAG: AI-2E family transporter [Phycisphaerales bacterium]|nr:AI-2E family transporter [Phycisphaerales bacterium]
MTEQPKNDPRPPAGKADWLGLHLWQIQGVRDVLVVFAVLGLLWLGQKISIVTVPLLLAILLAYLFEPVIVWSMRRFKVTRQTSVGLIIVLVIALVVLPVALGLSVGVIQAVDLVGTVQTKIMLVDTNSTPGLEGSELEAARAAVDPDGKGFWVWVRDQVADARDEQSALNTGFVAVRDWLSANAEALAVKAAGVGFGAIQSIGRLVTQSFGVLFMAFITAFFFFFISTGWVQVKGFGRSLLPSKHRDLVLDLSGKFDRVISAFIRGRLTIAFIQSIVFTVGYLVIGVPAAFILGPVVALLSIVPYLALVGVPISITLLALQGYEGLRGEWYWILLAPTLFYFLGQALDDYVWTPRIQGKSTDMSTPMILFASLAGGVLFGVFGLLIAIPIAACLKILIQEVFWPKFKAWAEGREKDFLPISRE